uniref:NADH dehydrogenase [ubiquinone] flavoprotein 3, mitochondrial n=1 Tax=Astatotilapia calliptera TaxID=8154 RepID=A0AAX7VLN7_ASTCA
MATFLFRIGRLGPLKRLQLENLGILRTSPAASFCTKTEKPAKPGKKTKSAATEAPDERANLLAYKTAVAFPVRLSGPGCFPAQSVDGTGPAVVSTAESIVAAQAITPVTAASEQVAAEPAADSDSDSTDSDSDSTDSDSDSTDSDSDSDSEDEKKKEIKGFAPEAEPQRITVTGVKAGTIEAQNEYGAPITPGVETPAPLGAAQATVTVPSVGFEKLVKSGPEIITREVTGSDVSAKTAAGVTKDAAFPVDAQIEAIGEALKDPRSSSAEAAPVAGGEAAEAGAEDARPAEAVDAAAEAGAEDARPAEAVDAAAEAGAEDARPAEVAAAAEASVCAGSTEEQMDLAPIVTETAGEELQTEATAEHSKVLPVVCCSSSHSGPMNSLKMYKEAAAVPSEPEELFDNSTYKNYQHHSYNPYTFADLDMQMAKFRLPQPSSGKPSPRH